MSPSHEVPAHLTNDLHWLMARAARGLGVLTERALRPHGLSTRGYVLLSVLAEGDRHNQLALGQAAAFDKSTVVRVLDELEGDGLVQRTPDESDRRARAVSITSRGRTTLRSARRSVTAMQEKLLGPVSSRRREEFLETLLELGTGAIASTFDTKPAI